MCIKTEYFILVILFEMSFDKESGVLTIVPPRIVLILSEIIIKKKYIIPFYYSLYEESL